MEDKTKGSGRQLTDAGLARVGGGAQAHYLPSDLGPIVAVQWADLHRRSGLCDSPEGQLMLAVLAQALSDYRTGSVLERRSAKNWFSRRGEGFDETCELLGIDPERARQAIFSDNPQTEADPAEGRMNGRSR